MPRRRLRAAKFAAGRSRATPPRYGDNRPLPAEPTVRADMKAPKKPTASKPTPRSEMKAPKVPHGKPTPRPGTKAPPKNPRRTTMPVGKAVRIDSPSVARAVPAPIPRIGATNRAPKRKGIGAGSSRLNR